MSRLSKLIKKAGNTIAKYDPITRNDPTFNMLRDAFNTGNWTKPYGSEKSAWDVLGAGEPGQITHKGKTAGGGIALSADNPKDRTIGRAAGTIIADYWTLGLFSSLAPKSGATMQLENGGSGLSFSSLTSPGSLSSTERFEAESSSVTPAQVSLAQSFSEMRRWIWYGVAVVALIFLFKKGMLK
jgi:hypothetical protein